MDDIKKEYLDLIDQLNKATGVSKGMMQRLIFTIYENFGYFKGIAMATAYYGKSTLITDLNVEIKGEAKKLIIASLKKEMFFLQ